MTRPCLFDPFCLSARKVGKFFAQETAFVLAFVGSLNAKLRIKIMESLATLWPQNELEICQAPERNSWVCFRKGVGMRFIIAPMLGTWA